MPVHETEDGKWKFGTTGKEYSSRAKAIKQGLAIVYSQAKKQGLDAPSKDMIQREVFGKHSISKKAAEEYATPDGIDLKPEELSQIYGLYPTIMAGLNDQSDPYTIRMAKTVEKAYFPWMVKVKDKSTGKTGTRAAINPNVRAMDEANNAAAALRLANSPEHRYKVTDEEKREKLEKVQAGWADLTKERRVALRLARGQIDMDTLKVLGPSYLGFGLAGMLLGRLISGKKKRWWGYGLGAAAGLGLNYLRRKYAYGSNILV